MCPCTTRRPSSGPSSPSPRSASTPCTRCSTGERAQGRAGQACADQRAPEQRHVEHEGARAPPRAGDGGARESSRGRGCRGGRRGDTTKRGKSGSRRGHAPPPAAAAGAGPAPSVVPFPSVAPGQEIPLSSMRKTIAKRLVESKLTAPHFYVPVEIDMGAAVALRHQLPKGENTKVPFNDLVAKACARGRP